MVLPTLEAIQSGFVRLNIRGNVLGSDHVARLDVGQLLLEPLANSSYTVNDANKCDGDFLRESVSQPEGSILYELVEAFCLVSLKFLKWRFH